MLVEHLLVQVLPTPTQEVRGRTPRFLGRCVANEAASEFAIRPGRDAQRGHMGHDHSSAWMHPMQAPRTGSVYVAVHSFRLLLTCHLAFRARWRDPYAACVRTLQPATS